MNYCSTNLLLLLTIAATTLPLNPAAAQEVTSTTQVFPPIAQTKSDDSDPLADADFYLQKSATQIAELQTFVDSLRTKNTLKQFPYRPVMFTKRDVRQARHTLGLAAVQIDRLPDPSQGDKRLTHKRLTRQLQRLENYLKSARTSLQALLDPQAFSNLKPDAVRFRGLGMMLANLDCFKTDPTLAAAIYRQLPAADQEADRLTAEYDLLIRQRTIAGIQLAGLDRYFKSKRKSFLAIAKQHQQALPQQIKDSLDQIATKLTTNELDQPVPQRSDASTDLRTQLRKTKADLLLLKALDPQASESMQPQRKQLSDLQLRLQNTKPTNSYAGNDREALLKVKAFTLSDLKPVPTDLRIPSKNWTRRTYWRYNELQWRQIDQSVLTFYSLPSRDGNASSSWQEYSFAKDHLSDDAISVRRVQ